MDSTFEDDMAAVIHPPVTVPMASSAERAWNAIAAADEVERAATSSLEESLTVTDAA